MPVVFEIGMNDAYAYSPGEQVVQSLFNKLYAPLNIQPVIRYLPSKRSLKVANEGLLDAEAGRVQRVGDQFEHLIKIPEPFLVVELGIFCLTKATCESENMSVVASVKGFEDAKAYCDEHSWSCLHDKSHTFIASAINAGSVDGLFAGLPSSSAAQVLCAVEAERFFFKPVSLPPSITYHYINKIHQKLVAPLTASMKALRASGAVDSFSEKIGSPKALCGKEVVKL